MRNTRLKSWVTNLNFPDWTVIIAIGAVSFLAYGLLIPQLGFYFDDWPNVYVLYTRGDLWEYLKFDRPFSAWTFLVTAPILGVRPLNWHIFTFIIRCLVSIGMWWTFRQIWPRRKTEVAWMALLFSIHPVFTQQSIALTYSQNFLTYALYFLSMGSMFAAQRNHRWKWALFSISLASTVTHIFTMEYFWGLEILRPVFIWIFLNGQSGKAKPQIKETLRIWWPYGLIFLIALVWREALYVVLFGLTETPNELKWVAMLRATPVEAIRQLIEVALKDFSHVMFSTWHNTIQPNLFDLQSNFSIASWILAVSAASGGYFFISKYQPKDNEAEAAARDPKWPLQAIWVGLSIFVVGTAPIWAIGKNITLGKFSDRFALPAMLGASILIIAVLAYLRISRWHKIWIVSILIGLAIGSHFRTANDFRWATIKQQRFFWQMIWRAPEILPETPVFSDGAVLSFTGDYPTGFALNLLYADGTESPAAMPFWFFELDQDFHRNSRKYLRGNTVRDDLRNYVFSGSSLNSLVIQFDYDQGSCLWVVDEDHEIFTHYPPLIQTALPMSNLDRIVYSPTTPRTPPEIIFGEEPEQTWCYFYQKAEILRSTENWAQIKDMGNEVQKLDYSPNNKLEWRPFIEGYVHTGNWNTAKDLTVEAFNSNPQTAETFCALWRGYLDTGLIDATGEVAIDEVYDTLKCHSFWSSK